MKYLYFVVIYAKTRAWCYIQVKIMYYSSKTYFLDQVGNIGANLGVFLTGKPTKLKIFKKLFLNLHVGPKSHLKWGKPPKHANSPLYPIHLFSPMGYCEAPISHVLSNISKSCLGLKCMDWNFYWTYVIFLIKEGRLSKQ